MASCKYYMNYTTQWWQRWLASAIVRAYFEITVFRFESHQIEPVLISRSNKEGIFLEFLAADVCSESHFMNDEPDFKVMTFES
jgi:DNA-directed RNA polymerase subunit E'/Rpb7